MQNFIFIAFVIQYFKAGRKKRKNKQGRSNNSIIDMHEYKINKIKEKKKNADL